MAEKPIFTGSFAVSLMKASAARLSKVEANAVVQNCPSAAGG